MTIATKLLLVSLLASMLLTAPLPAATRTAASCNASDVQAAINAAADGDTVSVPAGSCSWTTGVTVPSNIGITITGTGTPNSGASTSAPSSSCTATVITWTLGSGNMLSFSPQYGNSTTRLSCMEINTTGSGSGSAYPVAVVASCTSSGCPNLRLDNLTIPTGAMCSVSDASFATISNLFGVADHNSVGDVAPSCNGTVLVNVGDGNWLGVGQYGDNSWYSADTFGTNQTFYLENNTFNYGLGTDTDVYGSSNGGGRLACRFNTFNNASVGACYTHGTDTNQRTRGARQVEGYGNTINSCVGGACDTIFEFRSGVGLIFGNSINSLNAYINSVAKLDSQRVWRVDTPWGACDGSSVWDTNDGTTYYSGTIGSVSYASNNYAVTGSSGWSANEWANSSGAPYSFHDITQGFGFQIGASTANSITSAVSCAQGGNGCSQAPASSDSYEILRARVCMDQPTRSGGNLVENNGSGNPVLVSTGNPGAVSQSLDPTYEWNDATVPNGKSPIGALEGQMIANRDFYSETAGQTAQTSPTSPFNGSSGTGWGTLANRPTACTPRVGYFAADQGSWNTSGNGFGQGELFVCTATNTWSATPYYTPYTYPHPLAQGTTGPATAPPTNLLVTTQ